MARVSASEWKSTSFAPLPLPEQLAIARAKGPHQVAAYDLHKAARGEIFRDQTTAATAGVVAAAHRLATVDMFAASPLPDRYRDAVGHLVARFARQSVGR